MIIFDLDGTLWDTINVTYMATMRVTKNMPEVSKISKDTVKTGMGMTFSDNAKHYLPYISKEKREDILRQINKETIRLLENGHTKFYLGMKRTIKKLSKKYKLGIVTNNNDEYAKIFLKTAKLEKYFIDYMGAASYNVAKSEAIKLMLKRNNIKKGFYVGDTNIDMVNAKEARVTFIHAKYGIDKNVKTLYKINRINALPSLIKRIEKK